MEPAKKKLTEKEKVERVKARMEIYQQRVLDTFQLEPKVSISLKGQFYTLEFNNRAIKDVLKDSGFNILADSLGDTAFEDPNILGSLLHRGLQANHPDLTVEDVDKLFTARHYPYITTKIRVALDMFMPDMSDVERDEEPEAVAQGDPT